MLHINHIRSSRKTAGFTLVEIMIVVAIIALLAAIAVPNFLRARKRSQATTILNDLRMLDHAMDQYAMETGKVSGFQPSFSDLQNYLKTGTNLYTSGADLFGDSYGPFQVDSIPQVPTSAFNTLSDVADAGFWGQYYSDASAGGQSGDNGSGNGGSGNSDSNGANAQAIAQAQSALNSAQSNYDSILAQYNADMAANIGGQPRKDITAQMNAATQALQAAQSNYNALTSGT